MTTKSTHHVFCDESHISHAFRVQGGIWVPDAGMRVVRDEIKALRSRHPKMAEFKWTYVGGAKPMTAYVEFVNLLFDGPASQFLTFKCIVIAQCDDASISQGKVGRDLGFYKAYYTFLSHRLLADCEYHIRLDQKPGPRIAPEAQLAGCLNSAGKWQAKPWSVASCHPVKSHDEDLVQLADMLCGAIGWAWNGRKTSANAKILLAEQIRAGAGWPFLEYETRRSAAKMNVWRYRPGK